MLHNVNMLTDRVKVLFSKVNKQYCCSNTPNFLAAAAALEGKRR
jgi:hypothetical protein